MKNQKFRFSEATPHQGMNTPNHSPFKRLFSIETLFLTGLFLVTILVVFPLVITGKAFPIDSQAAKSDKQLTVVFFNVYQGDSVLISTPSGKNVLIDAGQGANKYARFDGGKNVVLPYLKSHNIKLLDQVVMTHPHADHVGGLKSVLDEITVREVLDPGMMYGSELYKKFLLKIESKGIEWTEARDGMVLDWGPEVKVQVLSPKKVFSGTRSDANNNSVVIKLIYQKTSFLFTGDIEREAEIELIEYGEQLRSNVLKVPHHGGEYSSTYTFVNFVHPELVVIMCGKKNKFGHPHPDTLETYRDFGAKIYRTDQCGTITMVSDGQRIKVSTETECK